MISRNFIFCLNILGVFHSSLKISAPKSDLDHHRSQLRNILAITMPILSTPCINNAKSLVYSSSGNPYISINSILDSPAYKKSLFNIPPSELVYPDYFLGSWNVELFYRASEFTERVKFQELQRDLNIGGFRKYSIAYMPDVGKNVSTTFRFINRGNNVVEDAAFNIKSVIEAQLSDINSTVSNIVYDPRTNANRLGFQYEDVKGVGMIELFVNSRKSSSESGFYSLVHQRQSSVRQSIDLITQRGGLPRASSQILCDYATELDIHQVNNQDDQLEGTFRIFSYLQPQDALFTLSPDLPVAVFQYHLSMKRK